MRIHIISVLSFFVFCFLGQNTFSQLVINELLINATTANNDGNNSPNTGEWTELLNNSATPLDISCYVMTDGDWSVTFPPGTILPPFGIITIGSVFSQIPGLDINLATCNCTSGPPSDIGVFTNGNEQLIIATNTGQIIDGVYWGNGQFGGTFTTSSLFGCPSLTIPILQSNPNMQQIIGSVAETITAYLPCNGSTVIGGNTNPSPDAPNIGAIQSVNPNASITDENCGTLGSIALNPTGGVGPYEYLWSGALGNTNAISGLQDGSYIVDITDLGQCSTTQNFSFVVSQNNNINLNITASNNSICAGESVTLTASGGSNYSWNNDPALSTNDGSIVTASPTATTTFTVEDNTGSCTGTSSITIQVVDNPTTNLSYNTTVCEGDNLILTSSTMTGDFIWTGPNGFLSYLPSPSLINVSQIQAGDYILTLTQNNCTSTFTLPVTIAVPVSSSVNPAGPFCPGDLPVDLTANSEPGIWSGPGIVDNTLGVFSPAQANTGSNNIVFQSNNSCTLPTNITIIVQASGDASINPIGNLCENSADIFLQTVTPGGIWSGNGVNSMGAIQPNLLGAGNYQAIYTLPGSCGATETLNFVIHDNPSPILTVSDAMVCIPSNVTLNADNANAGWQCEWWVDGILVGTNCDNQDFLVDQLNCINVQLHVTDGAGCAGSNIEPNLICGQMPPVASFTSNPEKPVATDSAIEFIDLSSNASTLLWEIQGENFTTPTVEYPLTGTEESIQMCLTAINAIGCEDKTCKIINILDDYGIYVPTAFTPNEDGYNDGFGPVLYNLQLVDLNYEFAIYSRDGEQVFLSKNPKQKWHGNKDGGDLFVLQDSYVWVLQLNLPGADERKIYRGDVKILR
jgi:hypothetical protein